jgi:ureidoglycolate lyase
MIIKTESLVESEFAPFGQVLACAPHELVRREFAARLFNDRPAARPNLRIQRTEPTPLPYIATKIERHRHSSQMFAPLSGSPYLIVVFPSGSGGQPVVEDGRAFVASGNQAVNYNCDTWHHGFLVLETPGTFLMLRWEDGTTGDEEFLTLPAPIRIEMLT